MFRSLCFQLVLLLLLQSSFAIRADEKNNYAVLQKYLESYNQHDIDGMLEFMATDVRWMNIDGDKLTIATTGKTEFRNIMKGYFEHFPTAKSTIVETSGVGDFITTTERAAWTWEGKPRSQCAMATYSFEDSLIVNVWYHVAQPCSE